MGRVIGGFLVAALFSVVAAPGAYAAPAWCSDDPVITIHSHSVHVTVGFDGTYLSSLRGPVQYVAVVRRSDASATKIDTTLATLPTTVSVTVLDDATFRSHYGPRTDVVIAVRVNAKKDFATLDTFTSRLGANARLVSQSGRSNAWLYVSYDFQR